MTADWIDRLEVVTGRGEVRCFARRTVDKNTAGYFPFMSPLSLFPGSEGTLGVVTRVWVKLLPDPGPFAAFILFFSCLDDALDMAVSFRAGEPEQTPRCVELFDEYALSIVGSHQKPPAIPSGASAALYVEFDTYGEPIDRVVERSVMPLSEFGAMVDDTVVAQTVAEKAHIRELRHFVPETCNRLAAEYHDRGGLKVSTEFCVPYWNLRQMLGFVQHTIAQAEVPLPVVVYGHVGNGHPHIFMRGKDREEVAACKKLAHRWYEKAVELGGTISGEHGIGKTRRDFLQYMYPPEIIRAMRETKRVFDPADILAIGNIFPETPPLVPEFFQTG